MLDFNADVQAFRMIEAFTLSSETFKRQPVRFARARPDAVN
jgi:hypothetical protein